jgi:hypothetical protein
VEALHCYSGTAGKLLNGTHTTNFWCLSWVTISIANFSEGPQDTVLQELLVSIFSEGAECEIRHPS